MKKHHSRDKKENNGTKLGIGDMVDKEMPDLKPESRYNTGIKRVDSVTSVEESLGVNENTGIKSRSYSNGETEFCFPKLSLKVEPIIDDTTLRDGVQMPGIAVSPEHTAHIARLLDNFGVERLELHHFQKQDQKAVKLIQDMGLNARLAGWCRAVKEDIDNALKCDFNEVGSLTQYPTST